MFQEYRLCKLVLRRAYFTDKEELKTSHSIKDFFFFNFLYLLIWWFVFLFVLSKSKQTFKGNSMVENIWEELCELEVEHSDSWRSNVLEHFVLVFCYCISKTCEEAFKYRKIDLLYLDMKSRFLKKHCYIRMLIFLYRLSAYSYKNVL